MSYDTKCQELAELFLSDVSQSETPMTRDRFIELTERLAQEIQETIESFIGANCGEQRIALTDKGRAPLGALRGES